MKSVCFNYKAEAELYRLYVININKYKDIYKYMISLNTWFDLITDSNIS